MVELHVTSLDVIHSFWAIQLGVKADANPQVDNIAFVKPTKLKTFEIRCAELCGIWHGEMFDTGRVVTPGEFDTWIHQEQATFAPATKVLPPYSKTYQPEPKRRGG
jgi:cytochrome c oxidase subunit II